MFKHQKSIPQQPDVLRFGVCILEFLWMLVLGIWMFPVEHGRK